MARPREFNEEQALDRAMEVFWRKGYQETSLDDLLEGMGIQRGSFYNTFGSKRKTYMRALNRYVDFMTNGGPYTELKNSEPGLDTLSALLRKYLASVTGDESPLKGCFFAHVAKEHRGNDPAVQSAVKVGVHGMRELLKRNIEAARAHGELPSGLNPEAMATLFMSAAWGMHVMAEAGVPLEELAAAGEQMFEMIRNPVVG